MGSGSTGVSLQLLRSRYMREVMLESTASISMVMSQLEMPRNVRASV